MSSTDCAVVKKARAGPIWAEHSCVAVTSEVWGIRNAAQLSGFDWPVPRGAVPDITLRTWIQPLNLNLLG